MTDSAKSQGWSRWLAGLLGGAGLFVLALSLLMLYVGKILLSDEAFAVRVSNSLEDPRVSEFVALRITDVVIKQQPDLTAFRPILVVVTRGVVSSDPFRALLQPALRKVHQALLSSTAENILLAIPDAGELIHEALKAAGPGAADEGAGNVAAGAGDPERRAGPPRRRAGASGRGRTALVRPHGASGRPRVPRRRGAHLPRPAPVCPLGQRGHRDDRGAAHAGGAGGPAAAWRPPFPMPAPPAPRRGCGSRSSGRSGSPASWWRSSASRWR